MGQGNAIVEHAVPIALLVEIPREEHDEIRSMRGDRNPTIKGYALPLMVKGTLRQMKVFSRANSSPNP